MPKRILQGKVISKTEKTIKVRIVRTVTDKKYGKILKFHKNYAAHDELNEFKVSDDVSIIESRPFSKTKFFKAISKTEN